MLYYVSFKSVLYIIMPFQDQLKYEITADNTCKTYLYLNPDTGDIVLAHLLSDASITKLNVSYATLRA